MKIKCSFFQRLSWIFFIPFVGFETLKSRLAAPLHFLVVGTQRAAVFHHRLYITMTQSFSWLKESFTFRKSVDLKCILGGVN